MKNQIYKPSGSRWLMPHRKRTRHPKIWLGGDVLVKWRETAHLHDKTELQAFEEAAKAIELFYANVSFGDITTLIHKDEIITLLNPVSLFCHTLDGKECGKGIRLNVSPEAHGRIKNVMRYTGLPMNIVLSIAVNYAALSSHPDVVEIKIRKHPRV